MKRGRYNFFKGRVDPAKWRALLPGEPGYGSRQYVRKTVARVMPGTQRLSVAGYQTAKFGMKPKERAQLNVAGRTEEQKAAYKAKRTATAATKKRYGGEAKIKEIRKIEKIKTREQAEKLTERERRRLGYLAYQDKERHEDFLNWIGSPPKQTRKSRKSRLSKERIMREADRRERRKAA